MSSLVRDSAAVGRRRETPGLKRYYETVRENWWVVLLCTVVVLGGAAAYVALAPRKYSAQAEMLVSPIDPSDTTMIGLPVLHATSDPTQDVLTAASLITTTQVASAVAHQLGLNENPTTLLGSVQATPIGQSNLIAVQATSSSARQAQRIANAFVNAVITTRSAALHAAVAAELPGLQAQAAGVPTSAREGPGSIGDEITQLQQLKASRDPTITVAAYATLPTGPYSPKKSLALGAGLIGGLVLGIAAAFAIQALDPRLRREEQLREVLRTPVLARIPRERGRNRHRPMLPGEMSFGAQEGYRTLRTMIASRGTDGARTILVTGSAPAEGKTTSAISLAAALAQAGSRVVLIEADLRRPTIASTLGLSLEYGTEHVLSGEVDLPDALVLARFGGFPVQVLAVCEPGAAMADRLSVPVAEHLITQASKLGDFIVIDSPPLTAVVDALPLARFADDVLLVTRLGKSKLSRLLEIHELLLEQGSYPTGILLIGESAMSRAGYYYRPRPQAPSASDGDAERSRPVRTTRD